MDTSIEQNNVPTSTVTLTDLEGISSVPEIIAPDLVSSSFACIKLLNPVLANRLSLDPTFKSSGTGSLKIDLTLFFLQQAIKLQPEFTTPTPFIDEVSTNPGKTENAQPMLPERLTSLQRMYANVVNVKHNEPITEAQTPLISESLLKALKFLDEKEFQALFKQLKHPNQNKNPFERLKTIADITNKTITSHFVSEANNRQPITIKGKFIRTARKKDEPSPKIQVSVPESPYKRMKRLKHP